MNLVNRAATEADALMLAQMNQRLIEDEHSRNPMTIDELHKRMTGWLKDEWGAQLFVESDTIIGYALYQLRQADYYPNRQMVYIRQFYIERDFRNRGLGSRAFKLLVENCFSADCAITIDVLASNPDGYRFWSRVGFHPYCTTMNLQRQENRDAQTN
ncbi:MAG: GNAT family N-acetyltransferase [Chloroflexi bacterium]|nr:GNAT family N-acetyltransferase [Chloroflexota bacterium]